MPCNYFHMVFTIPHELNPIILVNPEVMLNNLFASVSQTLHTFGRDPRWKIQGQLGFICVLHTWSQKLTDHFHIHCLIAGGALSFDKRNWTPANKSYLFRVQSLSKEFKKRYLGLFEKAYLNGELIVKYRTKREFDNLIRSLFKVRWLTYAKRPFAGPEQVLEYLGRYTHRVAISNNRIKSVDNDQVLFTYRDRTDNNTVKMLKVSAHEFIRRFLLHVLPENFRKIRYFGFLSHRNKKQAVKLIRQLIDPDAALPEKIEETYLEMMQRLTGQDLLCCPNCKKGRMTIIKELPNQSLDSS